MRFEGMMQDGQQTGSSFARYREAENLAESFERLSQLCAQV